MRHQKWLWLAALGLLTLSARAPAETIGVLSEVNGETRLLRGDNYIEAVKGVELEAQDIIETGGNAAAQLDMDDGSSLRLGPGTRLALTEYRLDSGKNVIAAGLDLLSGWLRFAVSKLKQPQSRYQVSSAVMTLGIRGTEGVVEASGEQGALHLETGLVEVTQAHGAGASPLSVAGGEYVQRQRGQALRKMAPTAAFAARVPPAMRARLARRALAARERGVPPRIVRAITREEAKRFIENHPHARERLQRRFQPLFTPGANAPGKKPAPGSPGARPGMQPGQGQAPGAHQLPRHRPTQQADRPPPPRDGMRRPPREDGDGKPNRRPVAPGDNDGARPNAPPPHKPPGGH
jgi:hypothetical protein